MVLYQTNRVNLSKVYHLKRDQNNYRSEQRTWLRRLTSYTIKKSEAKRAKIARSSRKATMLWFIYTTANIWEWGHLQSKGLCLLGVKAKTYCRSRRKANTAIKVSVLKMGK